MKKMRIACYGFVKKGAGSLSGSNFLILEELLKRGINIDFYGWKNFVYPQELCQYQNFRLFEIPNSLRQVFFEKLMPDFLNEMLMPVVNILFVRKSNVQLLKAKAVANHEIDQYDLLLSLGCPSEFRLNGIATISWVQGSPQNQWYFIQKLRKNIISLCGIGLYVKLKAFYALKARHVKSEIDFSDILICGSQFSKNWLISDKIKPESVKVLPYPVDLTFFKSNSSRPNKMKSDIKVFLWLGRSEPRKRLDLLLEAYALLLQERQDVQLKIFAGFTWAPAYKKLIDDFEFPEYLEYQKSISRDKVPELMEQCDVLIQPSEGEDFGISVAEALCCGLPVIVGTLNGTKDFISPSSFIFENYTPESLKNTMLNAIESIEQKREELALEARETAEKNFSVSSVADSLEDIFHDTLRLYQPESTN